MRNFFYAFLVLLLTTCATQAQDGKIIERKVLLIPDSVIVQIGKRDPELSKIVSAISYSRITYLSDGLKVIAYVAEPKQKGTYPCIISNRGGNRDFGQWNPLSIAFFLGQMASWNYVVVASQYRGNDGGEGKEEFGGKDVHDVLNLIPVLGQLPNADTLRIGIEGASRGGMMTYMALKETCRFKAAVVTSGMANAFTNIKARPEMEKNVFAELVPNYNTDKETQLKNRSAVFWTDKMCKATPLLLMQGSADWRVQPAESFELVEKLYAQKYPVRFILFEGADHGIREFRDEKFTETKRHFDYYVRDNKKHPSMEPHGQ
jgi:dipeptidyl aminopeptidase/acylaminoacyl peptidase